MLKKRVMPWVVPVFLLFAWQLASSAGILPSNVLPSPVAVVKAAWSLTQSGQLFDYIAASAKRALVGFLVGGGIGFGLGLFTGLSKKAEGLLDSTVQMVRNVPHLALIPIVILWFGIGEEAKLFLVALGTFFPIYLNTFHGIRSVDRALIEMGGVYGLKGPALFWHMILPGALPSILVGVRYALGVT